MIREMEPLGTFAARRFCGVPCKATAQRKVHGDTATCTLCGTTKPIDDFLRRRSGRRETRCTSCRTTLRREATAREPAPTREQMRLKARRMRAAALERDWIDARCRWTAARLKVDAVALRHLFNGQGGRCALTGRALSAHDIHIDHIVPRSKGGTDRIENLRWLSEAANRAKRALSDAELIALARDIVAMADHP